MLSVLLVTTRWDTWYVCACVPSIVYLLSVGCVIYFTLLHRINNRRWLTYFIVCSFLVPFFKLHLCLDHCWGSCLDWIHISKQTSSLCMSMSMCIVLFAVGQVWPPMTDEEENKGKSNRLPLAEPTEQNRTQLWTACVPDLHRLFIYIHIYIYIYIIYIQYTRYIHMVCMHVDVPTQCDPLRCASALTVWTLPLLGVE